MKIAVKYDINVICKRVLQEQLDKLHIPHTLNGIGEVIISDNIDKTRHQAMVEALAEYGIEIVTNQKTALIQKIKDCIIELIHSDSEMPNVTMSVYLSDKLNHSYSYLSSLFSEYSLTSIENFIILQKIERAKQLLTEDQLTLTQISYQLNYSSVAHLSHQFKKTTGLTPSAFQRIVKKRASEVVSS